MLFLEVVACGLEGVRLESRVGLNGWVLPLDATEFIAREESVLVQEVVAACGEPGTSSRRCADAKMDPWV
jgi:predicted metal-dependent TIM-barrel fold hydrolase